MQLNQKSAQQQAKSSQGSTDKYKELESQLEGFWAKDEWDMSRCPLYQVETGHRKYRYIRFCGYNSFINSEIKYVFWKKFENKDWSIPGFSHYANPLGNIMNWLNSLELNVYSLTECSLEKWIIQLRSYLEQQGKIRYPKRTKKLNQNQQEYSIKNGDDFHITLFRQIYLTIQDAYDDRDEYEKDVWNASLLGVTNLASHDVYNKLNFTEISQSWLKEAAKRYLKYRLSTKKLGVCQNDLSAIKKFSIFLLKKFPSANATDITRSLITDYFNYLTSLNLCKNSRRRQIGALRSFLTISAREEILNITKEQLIYDEDFPRKEKSIPRYIPQEVIDQLNQNLEALPPHIMRMTLVLQETGRRISEVCNLPLECLIQDVHGDFFLRHYQSKMSKEDSIPITKELASVIQEQQRSVRDNWGDGFPYLFPTPKPWGRGNPVRQQSFTDTINKMAYEKRIIDSTGKLWRFQSHQFRHTVGTKMVNLGVPITVIMRYLGHESPEMTMTYACIHDETLKREITKYHDNRVINIAGEVVESENPELDNNQELQWMKKKILAQALPNGSCARPILKGLCPHANACLTCGDFRTTKNFLAVHKEELEQTKKVIEKAKANGWQRQVEMNEQVKNNLENIILTLESNND